MEEHSDRAVSWFAVGCYYMCSQQYEAARRYFGKATALDRAFAPAWVAFGHAFAAQDESDQVRAGRGAWGGAGLGEARVPSLPACPRSPAQVWWLGSLTTAQKMVPVCAAGANPNHIHNPTPTPHPTRPCRPWPPTAPRTACSRGCTRR